MHSLRATPEPAAEPATEPTAVSNTHSTVMHVTVINAVKPAAELATAYARAGGCQSRDGAAGREPNARASR